MLMNPDRVLVLTGLGAMAPSDIEALGFRVLARPLELNDIIAAAARAMREAESK